MFVDASVIVGVLNWEPGWEGLVERLSGSAGPLYVSELVRFEATQAVARAAAGSRKPDAEGLLKARDLVDRFIFETGAENVAISEDIGSLAIGASARYGKAVGHRANLNFGDCFAYACAKSLDVPLLYKGNDFPLTDLG
jgi:ribonuclease VapC